MMKRAMPRGWAICASLAVHGVVLALAVLAQGQGAVPRDRPPRLATFAFPDAPEPPPARQQATVRSTLTQGLLPAPAPSPPAKASNAEAAMPQPAPLPAPPPVSAPIAAPTTAKAQPAFPNAAYIRLLWQAINARKPAGLDLAGRAQVVFTLDREGHLIAAGIAQSSGQLLLDRAALKALHSAAPLPAPPGDWSGNELTFTLEVRFGA